MNELLAKILNAHGGMDRWNGYEKVEATIVSGGGLLPMKGIEVDPNPLRVMATTHEESTVISPFGQSDWRMVFRPERIVIETSAGVVVEERSNPRAAFAGHTMSTPWDLLHRAYSTDTPGGLSNHSIPVGDAGLRSCRNCLVARGY